MCIFSSVCCYHSDHFIYLFFLKTTETIGRIFLGLFPVQDAKEGKTYHQVHEIVHLNPRNHYGGLFKQVNLYKAPFKNAGLKISGLAHTYLTRLS